jgi:hypothetical protein
MHLILFLCKLLFFFCALLSPLSPSLSFYLSLSIPLSLLRARAFKLFLVAEERPLGAAGGGSSSNSNSSYSSSRSSSGSCSGTLIEVAAAAAAAGEGGRRRSGEGGFVGLAAES